LIPIYGFARENLGGRKAIHTFMVDLLASTITKSSRSSPVAIMIANLTIHDIFRVSYPLKDEMLESASCLVTPNTRIL
jgi:hypothetical protein